MLEDNVIPINFGNGLDSKTDEKNLDPIKFQLIKDGIFTKTRRISKRNGYTAITPNLVGGGTLSSPQMMKAYRDELVCAAATSVGQRLLSYSSALTAWEDRGKYSSVKVTKTLVNSPIFSSAGASTPTGLWGASNTSTVVSGSISITAFDSMTTYGASSVVNQTLITVVDLNTGVHIANQLQITNALGFSKLAILGTSTFAIFYISSAALNRLSVRIISVSAGSGVTLGSEVTIGTCLASSTNAGQFPYCYDVVTTSTGATVCVANQPNINVYNINTAGATTASATLAADVYIKPMSINVDGSSNLWVYWVHAASPSSAPSLRYAIFSSSLAVVLASTSIGADPAFVYNQIVAVISDSTHQDIYYSGFLYPTATFANGIMSSIFKRTLSTVGVISSQIVFLNNADIYSKIFTVNSIKYMGIVSLSVRSATCFIVDLVDALPVAKFAQGSGEGLYSPSSGAIAGTMATITGIRFPGFMNSSQSLSSTKVLLGASVIAQTEIIPITVTANTASAYSENILPIMGATYFTFDFSNIDANQSFVQQDTLVLNGAVVSMYDGAAVSELGYNVDPDNISAKGISSGGSLGTSNYIYYVTYEWIDSNGNLYQSAPSAPLSVVFDSGSSNSTQIIIPTLNLTQKTNVVVKIWRSSSAQGGNIAYNTIVLKNSPDSVGVGYITVTDTMADATATLFPTLYTQNGAILDNIAPPPSMIMWTNQNRIWAVDSENPETTIEYSKTASRGTGISFSTGLLELVIDSKSGDITGASPMDEKTVILKKNGLGFFIGDGANDSGIGSTINNFQFVPSDVGCTNSKSVILYPGGVIFRSTKGLYRVSRGLQIEYFGYEVERYNSQDVQNAMIIATRNQIRFLTSSGLSLLYDYVMNQWSVFTNHLGYSADIFNDTYVYARTDGLIYQESTTNFLDVAASFPLVLQSAWIALSSVQNFERVRHMLTLGDYTNGSSASHGIQIQAAFDFSSSFGTAVPYYFGSASSADVFQYRNFFTQQKCDTISLLITELVTGASGECIDLTNMSFVAGIKKGANKVTASQSVG